MEPQRADAILEAPDHPCRAWIDASFGRVIHLDSASASIWTRKNELGVGIMLGAVHTRQHGTFGPRGEAIPEELTAPTEASRRPWAHLPEDSGRSFRDATHGVYEIYHPAISAHESEEKRNLHPEHDFYVAMVDGQEVEAPSMLAPFDGEPLDIRDPHALTLHSSTAAQAVEGEMILMMGYPKTGQFKVPLAASVGRVMADEEVERVRELQRAASDVPLPAYDPAVEFYVEGRGLPGMSGGGAYNAAGQQVGILVRAGVVPEEDLDYVRVVRIEYVLDELGRSFDEAPLDVQDALDPFLRAELM